MLASILIIVVSAALLAYWFRYTCVLILNSQSGKDYAASVASANRLEFPAVQGRLGRGVQEPEMAALLQSLDRDYRLLAYLIEHTAGLDVGGLTIEQRVLMIDFKLMRLVCRLRSRLGVRRVRWAMEEMSSILHYLANVMGERARSETQA
jgi:hypothetical protein